MVKKENEIETKENKQNLFDANVLKYTIIIIGLPKVVYGVSVMYYL